MVTLITNEEDRFRHAAANQFRKGPDGQHEIMPYLEDHFFDQPDRLADFALEKLKASAPVVGDQPVIAPESPDVHAADAE